MLNRRILRVKAFQTLYAYQQCKASNFYLAQDFIREKFLPDLNSMEIQDKIKLKKDAETTVNLFSKNLENPALISSSEVDIKIKSTAVQAINLYNRDCQKDLAFLRKNMVSAAERLPELYLFAIKMLIAFGEHVQNETGKKRKLSGDKIVVNPGENNLGRNKILEYLRNSDQVENEFIRFNVRLEDWELEIKEWFRQYIKPHEEYIAYTKLEDPSRDNDIEILQIILKKVIFKTDAILSFFQEKDLNWAENKSVVRSLALKVLKNLQDFPKEEYPLPEIALNWEEDKDFFLNIFNLTTQSEKEYSELISIKARNWDIDRIAITDKIILSMALTEMVNFPSIPVKVSINEYIDISKTYSTPKSKQFVNGILDVLAKELTVSGKIRKSGRGLIDNK